VICWNVNFRGSAFGTFFNFVASHTSRVIISWGFAFLTYVTARNEAVFRFAETEPQPNIPLLWRC